MTNCCTSLKHIFARIRQYCAVFALILLVILIFHSPCFAETVVLQWDPNPETDLAGYKVYYKADSSSLFNGAGANEGSSPVNVYNQTTATISGLDSSHTYHFVVTAYSASGVEISYSNIVTVPPAGALQLGDINGDGIINIADALLVLQIAAGNLQPSPAEILRGDVAPVINGQSVPNGTIDTGDAIVILSLMLGTITL